MAPDLITDTYRPAGTKTRNQGFMAHLIYLSIYHLC